MLTTQMPLRLDLRPPTPICAKQPLKVHSTSNTEANYSHQRKKCIRMLEMHYIAGFKLYKYRLFFALQIGVRSSSTKEQCRKDKQEACRGRISPLVALSVRPSLDRGHHQTVLLKTSTNLIEMASSLLRGLPSKAPAALTKKLQYADVWPRSSHRKVLN